MFQPGEGRVSGRSLRSGTDIASPCVGSLRSLRASCTSRISAWPPSNSPGQISCRTGGFVVLPVFCLTFLVAIESLPTDAPLELLSGDNLTVNLQSIGLTGVCGNLIIEIFEKSNNSSDYVVKPITLEWPPGSGSATLSITRTAPMEAGDQGKRLEEEKVSLKIPNVEYKEAIICSEMAVKNPVKKKRYEILPVQV